MTHPLIARAAIRAYEKLGYSADLWNGASDSMQALCREIANAVILDLLTALEEPSEAMMFEAVRLADERIPHLREAWRAMLAALRTEITAHKGE